MFMKIYFHNVLSKKFSVGDDFPLKDNFNWVFQNSNLEENIELIKENKDFVNELEDFE